MKPKPPVCRPVKIVYPGDPGFEQAVANGTAASGDDSGDDKAWTEFIHGRVVANPPGKLPPRPKR